MSNDIISYFYGLVAWGMGLCVETVLLPHLHPGAQLSEVINYAYLLSLIAIFIFNPISIIGQCDSALLLLSAEYRDY